MQELAQCLISDWLTCTPSNSLFPCPPLNNLLSVVFCSSSYFEFYIDIIYHQDKAMDVISKAGGNLEQMKKFNLILPEGRRKQMMSQSQNYNSKTEFREKSGSIKVWMVMNKAILLEKKKSEKYKRMILKDL